MRADADAENSSCSRKASIFASRSATSARATAVCAGVGGASAPEISSPRKNDELRNAKTLFTVGSRCPGCAAAAAVAAATAAAVAAAIWCACAGENAAPAATSPAAVAARDVHGDEGSLSALPPEEPVPPEDKEPRFSCPGVRIQKGSSPGGKSSSGAGGSEGEAAGGGGGGGSVARGPGGADEGCASGVGIAPACTAAWAEAARRAAASSAARRGVSASPS